MKTLTSNRHVKIIRVHKNAKRCTDSVSTGLPTSSGILSPWKHLVCIELIKNHQGKHISSMDIIFLWYRVTFSLPTKKKRKKEKRSLHIKALLIFFFHLQKLNHACLLKIECLRAWTYNMPRSQTFCWLQGGFLGWNKSRRGQKRARKSNPKPRPSKPYFLILSPHSTKFWVEISHRRYQRALYEVPRCEWKRDSQQTFEDLYRAVPAVTKYDFQATFLDSWPITPPICPLLHPSKVQSAVQTQTWHWP